MNGNEFLPHMQARLLILEFRCILNMKIARLVQMYLAGFLFAGLPDCELSAKPPTAVTLKSF